MEYVGLFLEIIFLVMGIYIYLYTRGKITAKDDALKQKAATFLESNGWWLRILSLMLIAIMSINIAVHIAQILGK